jgi:hypothetical protein
MWVLAGPGWPITVQGSEFPRYCTSVSASGAPNGAVVTTLSMAGALGTDDIAGTAVLVISWSPATGTTETAFSTSNAA